jgi:hypothetical protein
MTTPRTAIALPIWNFPNEQSQPFDAAADVALPAIGTTVAVVKFTVETALNGFIRRLANVFIGGGFQDGQGGVVWTLKVNSVAVPYYDNILNSLGAVAAPSELSAGISIKEGDVVELDVTNVSITVAGQIIGGRLGGYFYNTEDEPEGML